MNITWKNNVADVGPFKLLISNSRGYISWQASTPGYTDIGWAGYELATEEEAKAKAQAFVEVQLLKFLNDLGVDVWAARDPHGLWKLGTDKCEACYGTGRWGSNGSEVHEPCKGTGRLLRPAGAARG
jgi:hypothetical protein